MKRLKVTVFLKIDEMSDQEKVDLCEAIETAVDAVPLAEVSDIWFDVEEVEKSV